jgi:hypothetical protein
MSGILNWITSVVHAGGTGGLNWHLHARQSLPRWQPTLEEIEHFLMSLRIQKRDLILIGGSAGWMMPTAWLAQFERIDAYDIDPLAPLLFGHRHGRALRAQGVHLQHHRLDALAHLHDILRTHPNACVWFDNVLGQHRYRVRDEAQVENDLKALRVTLAGRSWGSLHDVLSGPTDGRTPNVWRQERLQAGSLDPDFSQSLLRSVGASGVWQDHQTEHVLPTHTPTVWMPWAFRPTHWHWLQAGWVNA